MKQILFILTIALFSSCKKEPIVEPARVDSKRILVDASHDGGVWWFPQGGSSADPDVHYQGKRLADLLRSKGFIVDEVPRTVEVDATLLSKYDKVIRAGKYGQYSQTTLDAYKSFLSRPSSLLLAGEFLRMGNKDELAEMLGLKVAGIAKAYIHNFAAHPITANVQPFFYNAGSVVMNLENTNIVPLGWLGPDQFADLNDNDIADPNEPKGAAVMCILKHPKARIFFIGDLNGLEGTPQPFTDNLIAWLFQ